MENKPDLVTETNWKGVPVKFEIFKADSFDNLGPIGQVYGFVFNKSGEVLLVSHKDRLWSLPGGHTENSETPLETLVRECYEEAAIKVDVNNCLPFFYQKAYELEGAVWKFREIQARYIVFNPVHDKFVSDPDTDNPMVYQQYIPFKDLREHLHWGITLDFVFAAMPQNIEQLFSNK